MFSLEHRVFALLLAAEQLRAGSAPDRATALLLAGAIEAYLLGGEPLDKALGLRARRGSHRTPQSVAAHVASDWP